MGRFTPEFKPILWKLFSAETGKLFGNNQGHLMAKRRVAHPQWPGKRKKQPKTSHGNSTHLFSSRSAEDLLICNSNYK
jgi:hypothetical protein